MVASRRFAWTRRWTDEEAPTTAPRGTLRTFLAIAVVVGVLSATPVLADTKGQLDSAKARLAQIQSELDRATAAWQQAEARYAQTLDEIATTRTSITRLQARVRDIRGRLAARARDAFEAGVGGTIELLLSSQSIGELSDRLEFLGSMAANDSSLVVDERVAGEQLSRQQDDLTRLSTEQGATAVTLKQQQDAIDAHLSEIQRQVDDLTRQYKAEQATAHELNLLGIHLVPGAALQVCPVAGPNSFVDSFGWPRPGGRTHQGIDMMAALGTPVVAAQPGNAVRTPNGLGGLSVIVYAGNGDYTYYAHLSAYGAGGSVSAGSVIGYVGNTGDASGGPYHLHFEYHPGGGGAIDPYPYLLAVC